MWFSGSQRDSIRTMREQYLPLIREVEDESEDSAQRSSDDLGPGFKTTDLTEPVVGHSEYFFVLL